MQRIGKYLCWVIGIVSILFNTTVCFATDLQKGIVEFQGENYDIRQDYTGELGFLFKTISKISLSEVSVPYFDGNVNTEVFIYEVSQTPQLDTQVTAQELTLLTSQKIDFDNTSPNEEGTVRVQLQEPIELQANKEFMITYVTGKIGDYDCLTFYNSGKGASPVPVKTSQDIKVLSCTFALSMEEGKGNLYSDGAVFAIDRQVGGTAFGIPNMYYTVLEAGQPLEETTNDGGESLENITQDDFEEVKIPSKEEVVEVSQTQRLTKINPYTIMLGTAVFVVVVLIGFVISTLIILRKQDKK